MKKQTDIVPVIEKELNPIINEALALVIQVPEDMPPAVELLSKLNQFNDKITAEKERITKPLNEALKVERSRWKPLELQNLTAIEFIRNKMAAYQTALVQKQKLAEQKIADKVSKGSLSIDKAIEKIEAIKVPEKEVSTTAGLVQFRETQVLKIKDEFQIPRYYLTPNEKLILEDLKKGVVIEGVELETIQVPVNYR